MTEAQLRAHGEEGSVLVRAAVARLMELNAVAGTPEQYLEGNEKRLGRCESSLRDMNKAFARWRAYTPVNRPFEN